MLTDLLTSSRGPGVIGTILALIVLLGFGGLMLLVSDNSPGSGLGAQIKEKEGRIGSLKGQVTHWKNAAVTFKENRVKVVQLEGLTAKVKRRKAQIVQSQETNAGTQAKTVELQKKFEEYKKQYRISERALAIGEEMAELKTLDGKVYERVKIKEVSALEIRFSHKNGNTGVSYKQLPIELQDRFQFSEADADAATEVVKKQVTKSVQGGEQYRISKKILDLKNKIRQNNEYIGRWSAEIRRSEAEISSASSGMRAALNSARHYRELYAQGRRGLTMDNAKKQERKAESYRKKISRAQSLIATNRSKINSARRTNQTHESEISQLQRELNKVNKQK